MSVVVTSKNRDFPSSESPNYSSPRDCKIGSSSSKSPDFSPFVKPILEKRGKQNLKARKEFSVRPR